MQIQLLNLHTGKCLNLFVSSPAFRGTGYMTIENKFKHMKKYIGIAAAFCIIMGFGMIHGSYKNAEIYGGSLIGIGSLILLYLLYSSGKKEEQED
jgi:hypothetical protein